ncbi:uncharacterized protein FFB20_04867 [Fusarium fujikuroi]|nr:uncharacterized protein FFB20_04867 [Fusarium fujikuroi]
MNIQTESGLSYLQFLVQGCADSTVAALASSLGVGPQQLFPFTVKTGERRITELWINERGQGAATTAAQTGAERSLLCGAHCTPAHA